jgi:hypothetical protein
MNKNVRRLTILALSLIAAPLAAQRPGVSRNQPLIQIVDRFLSNPFDTDAGAAAMDSGDVRKDVTMVLSTRVMPWRCYSDTAELVRALDALMDMAYVAANMRAQLVDEQNRDRPLEGMLGVLRVYPLIRARVPDYYVPEVDRWQQLPPEQLRALADSLAAAPESCPATRKRYPGKSADAGRPIARPARLARVVAALPPPPIPWSWRDIQGS